MKKKKKSSNGRIAPILSNTKINNWEIAEYLDCSAGGNYIIIYLEPELINIDVIGLEW